MLVWISVFFIYFILVKSILLALDFENKYVTMHRINSIFNLFYIGKASVLRNVGFENDKMHNNMQENRFKSSISV